MPLTSSHRNLTLPETLERGIGFMKGSIHYSKDRYFISLYWQGKRERIWRYQGEPIWHEKTAEKLLGKIQADIDNGAFDIRTYKPNNPLTMKAFSSFWLEMSGVCRNTKKLYRSSIGKAVRHFGADCDIRTITHSKLLQFQNSLGGYSGDTVYHCMTALKTMLRFYKKDMPAYLLPEFPPLSQPKPDIIEYLTYEEQQKILAAIPERHRGIFELMMEYGLRPGEARAIKWDCVTDKELIIKRSFSEYELRETTKSNRHRRYAITGRAKTVFDERKKSNPFGAYVFSKNRRGNAYDSKFLNGLWKVACGVCGTHIKLYNAVRHSLGCQLLDEGNDLELVRDVLGHTKTEMTRRYVRRSPIQVRNALERRGKVIPLENFFPNQKEGISD